MICRKLATLALTNLSQEIDKSVKSNDDESAKEIIVNIELLILCFIADPASNYQCTIFFVKRIQVMLNRPEGLFKINSQQITSML